MEVIDSVDGGLFGVYIDVVELFLTLPYWLIKWTLFILAGNTAVVGELPRYHLEAVDDV